MYCLKLFKTSQFNNNNNSEPRNHQFIIAEELLKLLLNLDEWQKPAGYKYRDAISPDVLHSIVCKIKPRYKLVIIILIYNINNFLNRYQLLSLKNYRSCTHTFIYLHHVKLIYCINTINCSYIIYIKSFPIKYKNFDKYLI